MKRWIWCLCFCLWAPDALAEQGVERQAMALEQRLLAPCCWTQTLDVHESPLVTEMRVEIRNRLAAGETPLSIEDNFAEQYGQRVRAMPRGQTPMLTYVQWVGAALVVALGLLFVLARSWMKRAHRHTITVNAPLSAQDAALDEQLDQALARAHAE